MGDDLKNKKWNVRRARVVRTGAESGMPGEADGQVRQDSHKLDDAL